MQAFDLEVISQNKCNSTIAEICEFILLVSFFEYLFLKFSSKINNKRSLIL